MQIRACLMVSLVLVASPLFAHHHFHAQAIAIGGDVPTASAVSLSPAGGQTAASAQHYDSNGIRFDEAISEVSGVDDGTVSVTTSLVTLRNVDIMGRVHIDEMSARMVGRQAHGAGEAAITFDSLRLKNVTVDGRSIDVRLDAARLNAARTFRALRNRDDVPLDEQSLGVSTSLADAENRTLVVSGLGTLYFGEAVVQPGFRGVTMLRIKFEPHQPMHSISLGTVETNGTDMFPP
ncbi:MAG TPA: hypothetical protein VHX14_16915 [Thermoanaerobaculia bacterium]|nr:hypothetical protein [Thermoanaerobaculia bacterium]